MAHASGSHASRDVDARGHRLRVGARPGGPEPEAARGRAGHQRPDAPLSLRHQGRSGRIAAAELERPSDCAACRAVSVGRDAGRRPRPVVRHALTHVPALRPAVRRGFRPRPPGPRAVRLGHPRRQRPMDERAGRPPASLRGPSSAGAAGRHRHRRGVHGLPARPAPGPQRQGPRNEPWTTWPTPSRHSRSSRGRQRGQRVPEGSGADSGALTRELRRDARRGSPRCR